MPASKHRQRDSRNVAAEQAGLPARRTVGAWHRALWLLALFLVALLLLVAGIVVYLLSRAAMSDESVRVPGSGSVESWRAKVDREPDDIGARLGLAFALRASGQLAPALAEYEKAVSESPHDIAAHYGRASVLMALGRSKDAETALWAALAEDETHVRAAEDLGTYYATTKQFPSLLKAVMPAVTAHPTEARLQYLTGLAYENTGHRDWALARYRLALEAVPDLPEALEGVQRLDSAR